MARAHEPRLLQQATFAFLGDDGAPTDVEMSVVLVPVSRTRASVMVVDNRARVVHGQLYSTTRTATAPPAGSRAT